jgi:putative peptidoglycan lipid II flippase
MKNKFTSTIAGASIFISVLGLVSRGMGFFRQMIFAGFFGAGDEFDLYLVGAVLPITINTVVIYLGQNYFVPRFQKSKFKDDKEFQKYFNHSLAIFFTAGIVVGLVLYFFSSSLINIYMHSSPQQSKEIASKIFNLFIITIPFSSGISVLSAFLQTKYEYKYPALSILFLNTSVIVAILLFAKQIGIFVIPVGYVVGTILQFIYLSWKSNEGIKLNLIFQNTDKYQLRSVLTTSLIIIVIIESVGQLYSFFDRYFYGSVTSGGIASLNYAHIIFIFPISVFSFSLATAIFPKISEAISNRIYKELERVYKQSILISLLIYVPTALLFFFYGDILIKLAFERGKFVAENTQITFYALKYFSFSIIFYAIYAILNKMMYSLNLIKYLLTITIFGILVKVVLNFILVEDLHQNGLALGTSVSYVVMFIASFTIINQRLKFKIMGFFTKEIFTQLVNSVISFLIAHLVFKFIFIDVIMGRFLEIATIISLYLLNLAIIKHQAIYIMKEVFLRTKLAHK